MRFSAWSCPAMHFSAWSCPAMRFSAWSCPAMRFSARGLFVRGINVNLHTRDMRSSNQRPMAGIQSSLFHRLGRSPVGVWTCREGAGSLLVDHSPLGNHGTLISDTKRVIGPDGQALELDGLTPDGTTAH